MTRITRGKVHGRTIEVDSDLGLADGQEIEVRVRTISPPRAWGDGLRRCAGALADEWTAEDDRILEEIHRSRHQDTRREISE